MTWTTAGLLPGKRELMGVWVVNGAMVIAGGTSGTVLDEVATSADGAMWTVAGALPARRFYSGWGELGGRRWSIGGSDGGPVWSSADGVAWRVETTNFPARQDGGVVLFTPR